MADPQKKIAVILLNLGGPERLQDVEPFLYNLFSDRKIIRLGPKFLQKPIARFIAWRRAPKSQQGYRLIGGGSPLLSLTRQQGGALEKELGATGSFSVTMAMRYWKPFARETLQELADNNISRVVALTLYPHYSKATTGSSLDDLHEVAATFKPGFDIAEVAAWPDQEDYIATLADTVLEGMKLFKDEDVQLVYSAHSLPVKFIEEGDPYLKDMDKTIRALEKLTGIKGRLCFQSRSGPVEWLTPSTPEMMQEIAGQGGKNILMVPISFVSDHVETLYEIDIQYKELAEELGLVLRRTESLNVMPRFIQGLKKLVVAAAEQKNWL
ncbi:MAG: ferrochelatase [Desulfobulbaceae bacterium]|nr:ferrochelatase [Desulfobulbaceae bacterium]